MYDVSSGKAMAGTSLYEVGKGSDQVLDTSIYQRVMEQQNAIAERNKLAADKKKQDIQDDIQANIAALQGKAIMPHDSQLIADSMKALKDSAVQNIDKINKGDIGARMDLNQKLAETQTLIAQSVDKRQQTEAASKEFTEHPERYTQGSGEALMGFYGSKHAGEQFDRSQYLKPGTNILEDAKTNLKPLAVAPKVINSYTDAEGNFHKSETKATTVDDLNKLALDNFTQNKRVENSATELYNNHISQYPDDAKLFQNGAGKTPAQNYYLSLVVPHLKESEVSNENKAAQLSEGDKKIARQNTFDLNINKTDEGNDEYRYTNKVTGDGLKTKSGESLITINSYERKPNDAGYYNVKGTISIPNTKEISRVDAHNKSIQSELDKLDNDLATGKMLLEDYNNLQAENTAKLLPTPKPIVREITPEDVTGYGTISKAIEDAQTGETKNKVTHHDFEQGVVPKNSNFTVTDKRSAEAPYVKKKAAQTKPKTVTQNGYIYRLNKQTEQYE